MPTFTTTCECLGLWLFGMRRTLRRCFFFSSRRRHTRCSRDWSSDVCYSDLIGFVIASALCGQAQNMAELVAFRALQGVFGGVLFASVFATIADLYSPAQRARLQGVFAGIFGIASVVGPV